MASVTEEKDALKKDLESQKYHLEKTIGKLQYRLKSELICSLLLFIKTENIPHPLCSL